jgi:hypothetical protein
MRYNIRNVCNYLPGDKESHSNNKYLEKLRDLRMFLPAISFKIPREFIKFHIRSINSRNFMDILKIFGSILIKKHSEYYGKAHGTGCIDVLILNIKTQ